MNNISNYGNINYSPNFGLKIFNPFSSKKSNEPKSADLLKEKGITIESCSMEQDRGCHTETGMAVLKHNDKEYLCRIPSYYVDGGYYSTYEKRYLPCTAKEEETSKYILEQLEKSGETDVTKFLEACNKSSECFMYGAQ